jgi:hypothetical protein
MLKSTGLQPGQEQFEKYRCGVTKRTLCQYDYRDLDNSLFSCIKPTLEACRAARDKWLKERGRYNAE